MAAANTRILKILYFSDRLFIDLIEIKVSLMIFSKK